MTLIIAFLLLGQTDSGWWAYAAAAIVWVMHLLWHEGSLR